MSKVGAPYGNRNAEKWTFRKAVKLFHDAIELVYMENSDIDFIGELARELGTSRDIFTDLKDKFPTLKRLYRQLLTGIEANCFTHSKKGSIKEATAIINLKANYGWKDRQDVTTDDEPVQQQNTTVTFVNARKDK